jgi:hypothetical protein
MAISHIDTWGAVVTPEDTTANDRVTPPGGRYVKNVCTPTGLNDPKYGQAAASAAHNAGLAPEAA